MRSRKLKERMAVVTAFWCHVVLPGVGAMKVGQVLRRHRNWKFSISNLKRLAGVLSDVPTADRGTLINLSKIVTGLAYINRLL